MISPPAPPNRIGVFCGSRAGNRPEYLRAAHDLGTAIARRGGSLVYGAGGVGLMGAVSTAAHRAGAKVFGVIPDALHERERLDEAQGEIFVVEGMHSRKALMYEMADAFVILPGGYGTMDELMEVATWDQLGFHRRPVVLANIAGFFDPLVQLLDRMADDGFMSAGERAFCRTADTAEGCLDILGMTCSPILHPAESS
ncbi:TIGR00730 family Rossman fold protein [Streptacidiphilus sp. P02-A3a]|uniref:LOG family protein n=1 Tax=Streptacidiphilus sp. P02-A3a TaxID=2704468 RepID=UPI0015F8ED40|nr:TIGR00730 family Rossman fold protein [Streptacidiphilus sp. P02-A3a]QMU67396.1 TIGR00730 family Rossman fold protein [Streptacidiphilus sp. P02-A3a]